MSNQSHQQTNESHSQTDQTNQSHLNHQTQHQNNQTHHNNNHTQHNNQSQQAKLKRRSSEDAMKEDLRIKKQKHLIESNKVAKWTHDVLMKDMDKFASARSTIVFTVMAYFLGHNIDNFLWFFIIFTVYVLILRVVRWWIIGWLFYLFEFCYFGLIGSVVYVFFCPNNKEFWCCIYAISTGVMSISIILFSNQAAFNSTDHISSIWLHAMPLISSWAIRWRHYI